jgi:hypothetical protein
MLALHLYNMFQTNFSTSLLNNFIFCITVSFCKDLYPSNAKHRIIKISNIILHKLALYLHNVF